jgi:hypothetical protein
VLEGLRCNETIRLDDSTAGRLVLEQTWRNVGVAPCYDSHALRWHLVDPEGRTVASALRFPDQPTTLWWPGEEVALDDMIAIPAGTPPGRYELRVEMVKPEDPDLRVQLGIAGRDTEGLYSLGEVSVERVRRGEQVVYSEGFEETTSDWHGAGGISVSIEGEARSGRGCLLAAGCQEGNSWNYAWTDLPVPVLPYSRYRLSCWMKVDPMAPGEAPYLKIGVTDGEGYWIRNFNTNRYDLSRPGNWQQLVVYAETGADVAGGHLAIEKGWREKRICATIRIDDVELTLLESP